MASRLVPTILNFTGGRPVARPWIESCSHPQKSWFGRTPSRSSVTSGTQGATIELGEQSTREVLPTEEPDDDGELKLPKMRSLVIMLLTNVLLQITFFIIVSSGSKYAEHLGGSATFSGLVIGVPTVISGMVLVPLVRRDGGSYKFALHLCCATALLGSILYALAYRAHFLYLILLGRIVMGISFAQFLYAKRYCSDPRIVGTRRRTTLAGWLVVGQSTGFTVGPFVGGLLFKVGFGNAVFNGYTSPGWAMAATWFVFWAVIAVLFEDVPRHDSSASASFRVRGELGTAARAEAGSTTQASSPLRTGTDGTTMATTFPPSPRGAAEDEEVATPPVEIGMEPTPAHNNAMSEDDYAEQRRISARQWAVTATMCWFAMTCFFVLGAWEANIPIFCARTFGASPFAAGNLIALGGVCTFPFMLANVVLARRVQDRYILSTGCAFGLLGLLIGLAVVATARVTLARLCVSWFFVALGFNLASTVTLSLLSKQMPHAWNSRISLFIQYSNYSGRVCGAVWGGAGVDVGMTRYLGLQVALLGIGGLMFMTLWKEMKAKTG